MTKQEYFKLLERTSLEGKFPSYTLLKDGTTQCLYRAPNGNKCAFGLLIPDDKYHPRMEKELADFVLHNYLDNSVIPEGMTIDELKTIQSIHDSMTLSAINPKWSHEKFMSRITPIFS